MTVRRPPNNENAIFKEGVEVLLKANICRKFSNVPNNFREWSGGPVALWRSGANTKTTGPGNLYFSPQGTET